MSIKVNVSSDDARVESQSVLPAGNYDMKITDVEVREVKEFRPDGSPNPNAGSPYYNMEFTIQEGKYQGRKAWTNAMLFEGALFTVIKILKALNYNVSPGELDIPEPNELTGKDIRVYMGRKRGQSQEDAPEPKQFFSADKKTVSSKLP